MEMPRRRGAAASARRLRGPPRPTWTGRCRRCRRPPTAPTRRTGPPPRSWRSTPCCWPTCAGKPIRRQSSPQSANCGSTTPGARRTRCWRWCGVLAGPISIRRPRGRAPSCETFRLASRCQRSPAGPCACCEMPGSPPRRSTRHARQRRGGSFSGFASGSATLSCRRTRRTASTRPTSWPAARWQAFLETPRGGAGTWLSSRICGSAGRAGARSPSSRWCWTCRRTRRSPWSLAMRMYLSPAGRGSACSSRRAKTKSR
mmetsp:Transcript_1277/g.3866  ORF Transcript_1277/g.3866 Transcript_1277/m.3866 type:complete len:258 (-) Transcript_1277:378-1151(-)